MSYRNRITLVIVGCVTIATSASALGVWAFAASQLTGAVDDALRERAALVVPALRTGEDSERDRIVLPDPRPGDPIGRVQLVGDDGRVRGTGLVPSVPDPRVVDLARDGHGERAFTTGSGDDRVRVYARVLEDGVALQVTRPLREQDHTLDRLRVFLLLAFAGILGSSLVMARIVTRPLLSPLRRLDEAMTRVQRDGDLRGRVDDGGADEVAGLARTFNEMMQRLDEARERERRFVADASHELRTPIAVLRGNLELIGGGDLDAPAASEALADVRAEADRMQQLVEDLLTLARAGTEQLDVVDLAEIARDQVEAGRRRFPDVTIGLHCPEQMPVHGVERLLDVAIDNLIRNAVQWTGDAREVAVEVADGTVRVRDRGPGVPEEDRARIWRRFDRGTDPSGEGSGLGLAIVAEALRVCGGTGSIEDAPGGGAVFTLSFTRADVA